MEITILRQSLSTFVQDVPIEDLIDQSRKQKFSFQPLFNYEDDSINTEPQSLEDIIKHASKRGIVEEDIPLEVPEEQLKANSQKSSDTKQTLEQEPSEAEEGEFVTDRYGFMKQEETAQSQASKTEKRKREKEAERERKRSEKWSKMVSQWDEFILHNSRKVKSRIRKGIPDCVRGFVWQLITQSAELKQTGLYENILLYESKHEDQISKDINRTFPKHVLFRDKGGKGQNALYNVLKAYSIYDQDVGYCQGMGFITALFLMYMEEEDAFWVLIRLCKNYDMAGVFLPGLPLLSRHFYVHEQLMESQLPRLYSHFMKEGVQAGLYATQWFITVFSYALPFGVTLRIWDIFLSEGYKVVFRIGLALLKMFQEELLRRGFEDALDLLKTLQTQSIDCEELIKIAFSFNISGKKLYQLQTEYERNHGAPVN